MEHAGGSGGRLSYDRLAWAHLARDGLRERVVPSPTEIRIKAEAAERTVACAEKRLAAETEARHEKPKRYELRVGEDHKAADAEMFRRLRPFRRCPRHHNPTAQQAPVPSGSEVLACGRGYFTRSPRPA